MQPYTFTLGEGLHRLGMLPDPIELLNKLFTYKYNCIHSSEFAFPIINAHDYFKISIFYLT